MARARRMDFGSLGGHQRTPIGGLRVPANLTRTGVLRYKDASGQEWGELRPPEEVFARDSLASLCGVPVTDDHKGMVTAENWRLVAVGHVGDDVRPEEPFVAATVNIEDSAEVALVEAGERVEVSCGYTCDVDPTAGVTPEGEPYNAIQRNIRYNHLALGPRGWGRAGADVSLRMDGAAVEVVSQEQTMKIKSLTLGGKTYRLDAEADLGAFSEAIAALEAKVAPLGEANQSLVAELSAMKENLSAALAKVAALEEQLGAHKEPDGDEQPAPEMDAEGEDKPEAPKADEGQPTPTPPGKTELPGSTPAVAKDAEDEDKVPEPVKDSIAEKRLALWGQARKILGKGAVLKGKSARQIHADCVKKVMPAMRVDSLSNDTLAGLFMGLTVTAPAPNAALAAAHADALNAGVPAQEPDSEAALRKMREDSANAWKKPLKHGARS